MSEEERSEFIADIFYFWTEKGDIERFGGYSPEKLREADPVVANAYEQYKMALETFSRLMWDAYDRC